MMQRALRGLVVVCLAMVLPTVILAETARGPVTKLPLPRYVSMKASEGNVRRGPSVAHRVDWIFKRRNMPVQIIAEYGHWRRVVDRDGAGGWMHYSLLSGARTVIVETEMTPLYDDPDAAARVAAYAEAGVIAHLGTCQSGWCNLRVGSAEGWTEAGNLWGVARGEERE